MKFKLLSIGQKFEYEGEVYIKTSPLIANNIKTSHNKMIPRYAILKLLDDSGTSERQVNNQTVQAQEVIETFNVFYEQCITTLEKNKVLIPLIKDEIDKARDEFTRHIIK